MTKYKNQQKKWYVLSHWNSTTKKYRKSSKVSILVVVYIHFILGSSEVLSDMDFVTFECPLGYVFEGSTNTTHFAFCHNWEYAYAFDLQQSCVRMYHENCNSQFLRDSI